jgi:hypothetical protein
MRRSVGVTAAAIYALLNVFVWFVLAPPPTVACSCVLSSIADMDRPENQVFVGTAGAFGPGGQPMTVELWLHGPGLAPTVVLARDSFGQGGGDCTVPALPPGTRWVLSTWLGAPGAQPRIDACEPHARLDTPDGQAMLREALTAFGTGVAPPFGPPSDVTPSSGDPLAPLLLIGIVILGGALLGGLLVSARMRS